MLKVTPPTDWSRLIADAEAERERAMQRLREALFVGNVPAGVRAVSDYVDAGAMIEMLKQCQSQL
jgi:hypothetical protein